MRPLSRRRVLQLGLAANAASAAWPRLAPAQARPSVNGREDPVAIAVPDFLPRSPADAEAARAVTQIVTDNLRRSGLFVWIDPAACADTISDFETVPHFPDWGAVNAQILVTGRVQQDGDRVQAEVRLWDVTAGQRLTGPQNATADKLRRVGHILSDHIYQRLTGEGGYFDSRVVFIDESGPKERRVRRLAVMDQDGANLRPLTQGDGLALTPCVSPSGREVAYITYGQGESRVVLLTIDTGQTEVLGSFRGMCLLPRFSPDGRRIVMTLRQDRAINLYVMDLRSRATTRLTDTDADIIDTAASHSPDGASVCFASDRNGVSQIYVIPAAGGAARRISTGAGAYSTPVWSPRGNAIAFTKQVGGKFSIGIMRSDGQGERILTEGVRKGGPTFAPNGQVLMFSHDPGGNGGPSLYTIDIAGRNEQRVQTPGFASDPSWSPLLS